MLGRRCTRLHIVGAGEQPLVAHLEARFLHRFGEAEETLVGRLVTRRPDDVTDARMAQLEQVFQRPLGGEAVVGDHRMDFCIGDFVIGRDQRQRHAVVAQPVQPVGIERPVEQQQPVGPVRQQIVAQPAVGVVADAARHQHAVAAFGGLADHRVDDGRVERVADIGRRHQNRAGRFQAQRAGRLVDGVAGLAHGGVDPLARRLRHPFGGTEHTADRRRRHTCVTGNILNCWCFSRRSHRLAALPHRCSYALSRSTLTAAQGMSETPAIDCIDLLQGVV